MTIGEKWFYEVPTVHYIVVLSIGISPGGKRESRMLGISCLYHSCQISQTFARNVPYIQGLHRWWYKLVIP